MKQTKTIIFALLSILSVLTACDDNDSFSTSTSNLLTFSTDTVRLDTVFSRVPSPTKTMWIYNRSGDGIRLSSVRLASGNQTGFRVNVNGEYLGETAGYQVQDIEIRKNDSIRVFVELTAPYNQKDVPTALDDDLLLTLESGVQQRIHLNAYSWDAELLNALSVKRDTTIQSTKPIVIRGDVTVDSAATLTIGAGTTLYFSNNASIQVYGRLLCKGTAEQNVTLRGDRLDHMFSYLPYDRVSGQWQGIVLQQSSYDNEIDFTDIHSAYNGIVADSSNVERTKLTLSNSTIHNCQGYGLFLAGNKASIWNTQITNTLYACAYILGGNVEMRHCTLAQFYPFDSNRGPALAFRNIASDKRAYPLTLLLQNTLVTGYADDVMQGQADSTITANYRFENCILRTHVADSLNTDHFVNVTWENTADTTRYGRKHFRKIDGNLQDYNFQLDSVSAAINAGVVLPTPYSLTDRLGRKRDDKPDVGCYEYY